MKKAVKGQQAMYKSTSATVGRKSFIMKEFTPASVSSIDVQISGFPTSYSYYIANEGIDGISKKDVSAANSVSNDWMGPGKAVCTITKSGIPSALLSVKSVSLFVNGAEFPGIKYTVGSDNTITINQTTGHTTWEQKDITAKVVYTTPDGVEFESNVSNTLTRHITGLPYSAKPPKNSGDNAWKGSANNWDNEYVRLHENTITQTFYIPHEINIEAYHKARVYSRANKISYSFKVGNQVLYSVTDYYAFWGGSKNDDTKYNTAILTPEFGSVICENSYGTIDALFEYCNTKIYAVSLSYR